MDFFVIAARCLWRPSAREGDVRPNRAISVWSEADRADVMEMTDDLAPLRRASDLLNLGDTVDAIVAKLQETFGLPAVDARAAVATVVLLDERGRTCP
jgi:hypothetical protein